MQASAHSRPIRPAHGSEVSDAALQTIIDAAARLEADVPTDADCLLIALNGRALFAELYQWRRRAELARDALAVDNVIFLAGPR